MATESQIKKMTAAMLICGVSDLLIDQVRSSIANAGFFGAPAVAGLSPREAGLFFDNEFWPEYPRRGGRNPKEPARKKVVSIIVSGENPQLILAGVRRLKQGLAARNKIGTEFVPMAVTWITDKGWRDDPVPARTASNGNAMGFYAAAAHVRSQMDD